MHQAKIIQTLWMWLTAICQINMRHFQQQWKSGASQEWAIWIKTFKAQWNFLNKSAEKLFMDNITQECLFFFFNEPENEIAHNIQYCDKTVLLIDLKRCPQWSDSPKYTNRTGNTWNKRYSNISDSWLTEWLHCHLPVSKRWGFINSSEKVVLTQSCLTE